MKITPYFILLSVIFILSCAASGTLGGGPRDSSPPALIKENSSPNYSTKWTERKITLEFDEYVVLRDPIKQVLVSPPLVYLPQYKTRGKIIYVEFNDKEVLKPDATYVFNFGESIQDFTEGNKLENFRFVFATGDKIDSLEVSGKIIDAFTGQPQEGVTVMLYDKLQDSAIVNEKPFYFSKTNKAGEYKIENIKKDTFRIVAIKDLNLSLTWNEASEAIAFSDSLVVFRDSVIAIEQNIKISQAYPKYKIADTKEPYHGVFNLRLNTMPYSEINMTLLSETDYYKALVGDTIKLWIPTIPDSVMLDLGFDTLIVKSKLTSDKTPKKLRITYIDEKKIVTPLTGIKILSSQPIASWDFDSITVRNDTAVIKLDWKLNKIDDIRYELMAEEWPKEKRLNLKIGRNTFVDIYGNGNDSLKSTWDIYPDERLANIQLNINGLNPSYQYLIQMLERDKIVDKRNITNVADSVLIIEKVIPGEYKIRIIEDTNNNDRWDPSEYWKKTQAEKVKVFDLEKLKENWTVESIINWKNAEDEKE